MKILIVETVWMGKAKYGLLDKTLLTIFSILPTLYARELAAITPKHHEVFLVNERYDAIDFNASYDLVHINFTTSTAPRAYAIADTFRKKGTIVVLSGLHASALPNEAKQHADSVIIGRGERSWLVVLDDIEHHRTLQPIYQHIQYDDSMVIPPTSIRLPGFVITGAIEATRGCPFQCGFCPEANIPGGNQYYRRPVDEVISEIRSLPQKTFMFYDASLTIDSEYTKTLFKKMIGLGKHFFCNGNADVLAQDIELVDLSKKAGCVSCLVGFESLSQQTIDAIGKKTNDVDQYAQAVRNIHKNKMAVIGCFMFGFDTDTKNVFKDTLKAIKDLEIDVADFCIVTPFPGTPLFEKLQQEHRILTTDWEKYSMKNVVFTPKQMSVEELLNGVRLMYAEYYSPGYTMKRIVCGLSKGLYPFLLVVARNMVATMNSRRLFENKQKNNQKKRSTLISSLT